ncbi:MAG: hypothetical protein HY819_08455 [Acidobacteria bacterium]|nr:hypothetical protein [Acidobacteriota bacterium]
MGVIENLVLIGGHSRNIGKTSVVTGIINGLSELNWTAVKITQTGHKVCAKDGMECGCEVPLHEFILTEEKEKSSRADTTRFLAAGARRSLWLRTRAGELVFALPKLKSEIESSDYVIIESNSLRKFWTPKLYIQVLDPMVLDFKLSARQFFDLADAYILINNFKENINEQLFRDNWKISSNIINTIKPNTINAIKPNVIKPMEKPYFGVKSKENFISEEVLNFVRKRLCG